MSYIYEALQRAEAERSGGSVPTDADSVADLLQKVEQEIDRKLSVSELPPAELAPAKIETANTDAFALADTGGIRSVGMFDGSGQPGSRKISSVGVKAPTSARMPQAQTDRDHKQHSAGREEYDCLEPGSQSISKQGSQYRACRW
jgi:hypothetical protein